jgi:hypothetical protein
MIPNKLQLEREADVTTIQQAIKEREIEIDALRAFAEQQLQNERFLLQQRENELKIDLERNIAILADREGEISRLKNDILKLHKDNEVEKESLRQHIKLEDEERFKIRWKEHMEQLEERHRNALDECIQRAEHEAVNRIEHANNKHLETITALKAHYCFQISTIQTSHEAEMQTLKSVKESELKKSHSSLHESQSQIKLLLQKQEEDRLALMKEKSEALKNLEVRLQAQLAEAQHNNFTLEIVKKNLQTENEAMTRSSSALVEDNRKLRMEVESARSEVIDKDQTAKELTLALQNSETFLFQTKQQSFHIIEGLQQKLTDANLALDEQRKKSERELAELEDRSQETLRDKELKVRRLETKLQNLYQSEKTLKKIIKMERRLKEDIHHQEQAKAEMLQRASMQLLRKDHNLSEQISILIEDNKAITSELRQLKHLPSVEPSPIDTVADTTDTAAIDKVVRLLKMKYRSVALQHKAEKDAAVSAFHLMLRRYYKILQKKINRVYSSIL